MEKSYLNSIPRIGNDKITGEEESKHDKEAVGKATSFKEKWKNPVFKEKFTYSMYMAGAFTAAGMYSGQHGPAFLDIQIITNTNIKTASTFFTGSNVGFLTGCIITGLIYNKMNKALLIFIASFGNGVVNICVPYCTQYVLMMAVQIITATFAGIIETGISSEHMRIWGSDANGLLQFLHCCSAIGGCIAPLIAEPFLAEKVDFDKLNTTIGNRTYFSNATDHNDLGPSDTRIEYLFLIVGLCTIISSLPFLAIFFKEHGKSEPEQKVQERKFSRKGVPLSLLIVMLFGICLFFFVYCSVKDTFFSFLMTFLVEGYDSISKTKGALVTSVAWAVLAVSRFLMMFVTKVLNTVPLLFLMTISMAVAYSLFTIFAHYGIVYAFIVCSVISALSCSGVYPTGFSWVETEMFQVTGLVSSCILVASSLGSIVNPPILGYLMEEVNNMWFCYMLVMNTIILLIMVTVLVVFSRYYIDKKYGTLASTLRTNATILIDPLEKHNSNNDDYVDGAQESFIL